MQKRSPLCHKRPITAKLKLQINGGYARNINSITDKKSLAIKKI
jgi:hypothetical protein